jgi:hypothetical protein
MVVSTNLPSMWRQALRLQSSKACCRQETGRRQIKLRKPGCKVYHQLPTYLWAVAAAQVLRCWNSYCQQIHQLGICCSLL